jgi:hypothetical protein
MLARRIEIMRKYLDVVLALAILSSAAVLSAQVTVTVTPGHVPVTFTGTVQFTATVTGSTNGVKWAVNGAIGGNSSVGTISTSGLYTPPSTVGSYTIAAKVIGSSAKGTATVYVEGLAGVYTYQYNNQHTGQNISEIALTPGNVNKTNFGKLFTVPLDGYVRAQPLYMASVLIPNQGYHDLVFVATENNSVYAIDADGLTTTPIWQTNFNNAAEGIGPIPSSTFGSFCPYCLNQPQWGITATPVIDPTTNTIYVEARTQQVSGSETTYFHTLHALDVTTGEEKFNGPVVIQASVAGTGLGSVGGEISFDPFYEMIRPALLFVNGTVYMGAASLGDYGPYHGWVLAYSAASGTLQQTGVWMSTPNGEYGGVWEDGAGLTADSNGYIYASTGNGTFDVNTGGIDYSESVLQLSQDPTTGDFSVESYFTPYDQAKLTTYDWDVSSAGVTILPEQSGTYPYEAIAGGKEGTIYVLNVEPGALGGYNPSGNTQIPQSITGAIRGSMPGQNVDGFWNEPAYWNGYVYIFALHDVLRVFSLTDGVLSDSSISEGTIQMNAPVPVVSANGSAHPVVWALQWESSVLRAYKYNNMATEIYATNQDATRDAPDGHTAKSAPIVANGRVYLGTSTNLDVYGLLP